MYSTRPKTYHLKNIAIARTGVQSITEHGFCSIYISKTPNCRSPDPDSVPDPGDGEAGESAEAGHEEAAEDTLEKPRQCRADTGPAAGLVSTQWRYIWHWQAL